MIHRSATAGTIRMIHTGSGRDTRKRCIQPRTRPGCIQSGCNYCSSRKYYPYTLSELGQDGSAAYLNIIYRTHTQDDKLSHNTTGMIVNQDYNFPWFLKMLCFGTKAPGACVSDILQRALCTGTKTQRLQ